MTYLCAIEAMNLDNMFSDCQDLSTIRGGGLCVLHVARDVALELNLPPEAIVSAGASQGLLLLEGPDADTVRRQVKDALSRLPLMEHATIFVAVYEAPQPHDFATVRAQLVADLRWQQMQSPSVIYPALRGSEVCSVDRVRPGSRRHDLERKGVQSDFTYGRRTLGRKQRNELLHEVLGISSVEAAAHLGQLVDHENEDEASQQGLHGSLNDKLCVLRFDGNDFGKRSYAAAAAEEVRGFSNEVRHQQRQFFRRLLLDSQNVVKPEWWTRQGRLALELVVFGGDEVTFVVPAWLGWSSALAFYEHVEEQTPHLTYAGGIVFCHFKTPVHSVRKLAGELVDAAKEFGKAENSGTKGNFAMTQVLESFDSIGQDLTSFLSERFASSGNRGVSLGVPAIRVLEQSMPDLRETLSRRRLHSLAQEISRASIAPRSVSEETSNLLVGKPQALDRVLQSLTNEGKRGSANARSILHQLHGMLGNAVFLHILELWDYAGVEAAQEVAE